MHSTGADDFGLVAKTLGVSQNFERRFHASVQSQRLRNAEQKIHLWTLERPTQITVAGHVLKAEEDLTGGPTEYGRRISKVFWVPRPEDPPHHQVFVPRDKARDRWLHHISPMYWPSHVGAGSGAGRPGAERTRQSIAPRSGSPGWSGTSGWVQASISFQPWLPHDSATAGTRVDRFVHLRAPPPMRLGWGRPGGGAPEPVGCAETLGPLSLEPIGHTSM